MPPFRWLVPRIASALVLLAGSAAAQVTFTNQATAAGVDIVTYGRGAAMVDFDLDGSLDLAMANDGEVNVFFRQLAAGAFMDMASSWNIPQVTEHTWTCVAADFDNDADPDVFFGNGGYYQPSPNALLRNDIPTSGTFTDISGSSGHIAQPERTFGSTTLDHDNDGDLDLFLADRGNQESGNVHLLDNNGAMIFTDVSTAAGLDGVLGDFRHTSIGDLDNDGWMDVGVANNEGANRILRNLGNGTFTEVGATSGLQAPQQNFGVVFEDFDNDGWQDVYVAKWLPAPVTETSRLFLNNADGTFQDVSAVSGITGQTDMGHMTGDVDADGHADIFVGTGSPPLPYDDDLFLITPDGSGGLRATNVFASAGMDAMPANRSHGCPFGDIDGDGDVDIYLNTGGPIYSVGTNEPNILWINDGNARHWASVDLVGVLSNRDAVGARVLGTTNFGREIHLLKTRGKGFGNTSAPTLHFGLGDADTSLDRIVVTWPSGIAQTLLQPETSERHEMIETGLIATGNFTPGGFVDLTIVGPPGHVAELLVGAIHGSVPLKKFGGVLEVLPPFIGPIPIPLDGSGVVTLPLAIPMESQLIGGTAWIQTWVHDPSQTKGGTLAHAVPILIQ